MTHSVEPARRRKLLGRDPLLWSALITGAVTTAGAFTLGLDAGAAGAINGLVVAVMAVWTTRPRTPGMFTGIVAAAVALLAHYGIELGQEQMTALNGLVLAGFALVTRQQVDPADTAISRS